MFIIIELVKGNIIYKKLEIQRIKKRLSRCINKAVTERKICKLAIADKQ